MQAKPFLCGSIQTFIIENEQITLFITNSGILYYYLR